MKDQNIQWKKMRQYFTCAKGSKIEAHRTKWPQMQKWVMCSWVLGHASPKCASTQHTKHCANETFNNSKWGTCQNWIWTSTIDTVPLLKKGVHVLEVNEYNLVKKTWNWRFKKCKELIWRPNWRFKKKKRKKKKWKWRFLLKSRTGQHSCTLHTQNYKRNLLYILF